MENSDFASYVSFSYKYQCANIIEQIRFIIWSVINPIASISMNKFVIKSNYFSKTTSIFAKCNY